MCINFVLYNKKKFILNCLFSEYRDSPSIIPFCHWAFFGVAPDIPHTFITYGFQIITDMDSTLSGTRALSKQGWWLEPTWENLCNIIYVGNHKCNSKYNKSKTKETTKSLNHVILMHAKTPDIWTEHMRLVSCSASIYSTKGVFKINMQYSKFTTFNSKSKHINILNHGTLTKDHTAGEEDLYKITLGKFLHSAQ